MDKNELIKKENVDFFYANLEKYLKDPELIHKYLVIHYKEVKKSFKKFPEALEYAVVNLPKNEYIIQQVFKNDEIVNFIF